MIAKLDRLPRNSPFCSGWTFVTRLSLATLQATGMAFFGLYGSTAALTTIFTLSAVVSCVGIGSQRGTDTRRHLVTNDASGAPTLVDLGASFAIATGGVLTLTIAAAANAAAAAIAPFDPTRTTPMTLSHHQSGIRTKGSEGRDARAQRRRIGAAVEAGGNVGGQPGHRLQLRQGIVHVERAPFVEVFWQIAGQEHAPVEG